MSPPTAVKFKLTKGVGHFGATAAALRVCAEALPVLKIRQFEASQPRLTDAERTQPSASSAADIVVQSRRSILTMTTDTARIQHVGIGGCHEFDDGDAMPQYGRTSVDRHLSELRNFQGACPERQSNPLSGVRTGAPLGRRHTPVVCGCDRHGAGGEAAAD